MSRFGSDCDITCHTMMIDSQHPLLLGSGSPRRRAMLQELGIPLEVRAVSVDETVRAGEHADEYLERVVAAKLRAAAEEEARDFCAAILVADTSVLLDQEILGKPRDDAEARRMVSALSGRAHRVATRYMIALASSPEQVLAAQTVTTTVVFRVLDADAVAAYVAAGESADKAGGYAIQGRGAFLVSRIEGSYSNVVGLPLSEVTLALQGAGLLGPLPFDTAG